MNEFIKMVTSRLGIEESSARSATSGLLGFAKDHADPGDFSQLLEKLPGAGDLLGSGGASKSPGAGGGGIGGLLSMAGSAVGGKLGAASGLIGVMSQSGLDTSQAGSFVSLFIGFLKDKAGASLVSRILEKVPELAKLAG